MSFTIYLQRNSSENNALTKNLITIAILEGTLKEDSSIIDPLITITGNISDVASVNYMSIPVFKRSYFVNNITVLANDMYEIQAHVDVLTSFKDEIRQNEAIIARQSNQWNLYVDDGVFKTYNDPIIDRIQFPNGFTSEEYVLAVAGTGGSTVWKSPSFIPYADIYPSRDEAAGWCTQYVVARTNEAFGTACVGPYGNANTWLTAATNIKEGWTGHVTNDSTQLQAGDVVVFNNNLGGHVIFIESVGVNDYCVISQSNNTAPGGTYGSSWAKVINGRKYRFSCTDHALSTLSSYMGDTMLGYIRYTGS